MQYNSRRRLYRLIRRFARARNYEVYFYPSDNSAGFWVRLVASGPKGTFVIELTVNSESVSAEAKSHDPGRTIAVSFVRPYRPDDDHATILATMTDRILEHLTSRRTLS